MNEIGFLSNATSANEKTGNVPQIMVGATREESIQSCASVECPLLHRKHGGKGGVSPDEGQTLPTCYSQSGTGALAHAAAIRKAERTRGTPESNEGLPGLRLALSSRAMGARIVRLASIGDPASLDRDILFRMFDMVESAGLKMIGYTHGWRTKASEASVEFMKRRVMASCDTLEDVDEARALGWQAAVTLPASTPVDARPRTPGGVPIILCPAMTTKARRRAFRRKLDAGTISQAEVKAMNAIPFVTCNTCLLCTGDKKDVIGFPFHDNANQHTIWRD